MSVGFTATRVARAARKRANGIPVTLRRGEGTGSAIATIGRTRRDQQQADGFFTRTELRDYLIDVADYQIDGEQTTPDIDDEIHETVAGRVYVYRLTSPGGSEPRFLYSDRWRITWRIHCELIDERDAE